MARSTTTTTPHRHRRSPVALIVTQGGTSTPRVTSVSYVATATYGIMDPTKARHDCSAREVKEYTVSGANQAPRPYHAHQTPQPHQMASPFLRMARHRRQPHGPCLAMAREVGEEDMRRMGIGRHTNVELNPWDSNPPKIL